MAVQADEPVPLPRAPPPRPAARQAAIDAALHRFDGLEAAAARPDAPRGSGWKSWISTRQRAAGAFATAALVLVVSLPVGLGTLREPEPTSAPASPGAMTSAPACTGGRCAGAEAAADTADAAEERLAFEPANSVSQSATPPSGILRVPQVADGATERAPARVAPPAPAVVAAAPPPPPPPAATSSSPAARNRLGEATEGGSEVVVTGSRVQRPNLSDRAIAQASPLAIVDRSAEFVSDLRAALSSGDRRGVIRLVRLPLRVNRNGTPETYRSATALDRDFDRIFTPAVRASLAHAGQSRETETGSSDVIVGRLLIGPACEAAPCPATSALRIKEVTP